MENKDVIQTLTIEQIQHVSDMVGVTLDSVKAVIRVMNNNDFIALGIVDMTPDVVMGFVLCEMQNPSTLIIDNPL